MKRTKGYKASHGGIFRESYKRLAPSQIASRLIQEIRKLDPGSNPTFDESSQCIINGRNGISCYIGNLIPQAQSCSKEEFQGQIGKFARAYTSPPRISSSYSAARDRVFPLIKPRSAMQDKVCNKLILSRPFAENFCIQLYEDTEDALLFLTEAVLSQWEVLEDELFDVAQRNLHNRTFGFVEPPIKAIHWCGIGHNSKTGHIPLWTGAKANGEDAANFILTGLRKSLPLKGQPVVMIPNRDAVFITGDEDIEGLGLMAEICRKELTKPYRRSGIPIRYNGTTWETFRLPIGHPHHAAFDRLYKDSIFEAYRDLIPALDQNHSGYVAHCFMIAETSGKGTALCCTYSAEIHTLLPEVDCVSVVVDLKEDEVNQTANLSMIFTTWDRFKKVAGDRLQKTDHYPPRYLMNERFTPEEIAELKIGQEELLAKYRNNQ